MVLRELGYILLFAIPLAALFWTLFREKLKRDALAVFPFDELRRRPPGESTRLKIVELDERIDPWLMTLIGVPVALAFGAAVKPPSTAGIALFFCARRSRPAWRGGGYSRFWRSPAMSFGRGARWGQLPERIWQAGRRP